MDLQEIRKRIKRLDYDVVKRLNQRMELALRSTRLRDNPVDEEEKDFRENIRHFADGLVDNEFLDILFEKILSRNRQSQRLNHTFIGFQGENSNFTRFVILSQKPNESHGNKCSIVFTTPHECGALNKVLTILSSAGINLTRIESRPSRTETGNFFILVDFNSSTTDPKIAETLAAVKNSTIMYKLLGCYYEAQQPLID
jgi:chorismate mutase